MSARGTEARERRRVSGAAEERHSQPSAVEQLDRAVHLLRALPLASWIYWFVGGLPFILLFLLFWFDLSYSPRGANRLTSAAGTMVVAYIWMKVFQMLLTRAIWKGLTGEVEDMRLRDWIGAIRRQVAIHGAAVVVVPLAALVTVPFGWTFAAFQNALILEAAGRGRGGNLVKVAVHQSRFEAKVHHTALATLLLVFLVLWVNCLTGLIVIPWGLQQFFNIETIFTLSGAAIFNSMVWLAAALLGWWVMSPLVKAFYAIQLHRGLSQQTGDDLVVRWRRIQGGKAAAFLIPLGMMLIFPGNAPAGEETGISPPQLEQAIRETLQDRRYEWRYPPEPSEVKEMEATWLAEWMETFSDWLDDLFKSEPRRTTETARERSGLGGAAGGVLWILVIVLLVLIAVAVASEVRMRRTRNALPPEEAPKTVPDIETEDLVGDELPVNEWQRMGDELAAQGELRKAVRAYFLAHLSLLGERRYLALARFKSNSDYHRELIGRMGRSDKGTIAFAENMRAFEFAWYGGRGVSEEQVKEVRARLPHLLERGRAA